MSVATPDATPKLRRLASLDIGSVLQSPENPREHFPEEELDKLVQSIAKEGILVPVVVYPDGDAFRLIDGERRWRAAHILGLDRIPAVVTDPPSRRENLERMFNIHAVREQWQDMPTAKALKGLMDESGITSPRELSDITGLNSDRIRRLQHALELPKEYQRYIDEGTIPLNFFWELKRNVIEPLAKKRPALWEEFQESQVLSAFVEKRLAGTVTDPVSFRRVLAIINWAEKEVDDPREPSLLDETLRQLILDESATVDEAYQDTVEVMVEVDKLERRTANVLKGFNRLLRGARTTEERAYLKRVAAEFANSLEAFAAEVD
jgi:ParB/RepB/Spo0J family partition protein